MIATTAGLDVGQVVQHGAVRDDSALVATTDVDWVRVNFRLDDFPALDDAWFAAYDQVVDAYLARGIAVYGLVNDEAVATAAPLGSADWIAAYVEAATAIVDHFKDRVRVYELVNEPNDYAGGTSARLPAAQFADTLAQTYAAVKTAHADDACWQVDLVSGPLLSFDGTSAADYLQATFDAWGPQASYPLDGVGYHLYVAQGADSSDGDVATSMAANLDATRAVVAGAGGAQPFWVSEYGWRDDAVGDADQAARMQVGFDTLAARGDVAAAVWFTEQDFPDNAWGVFDAAGARRPSADQLAAIAAANRPALDARVVSVAAPAAMTAGATGDVVVTVANRGATAWLAGDDIRLGAAAGCPDATVANVVTWQPADGAGYASGVADARVLLASDVAPGAQVAIDVPVRAPDEPGTYEFGARMVDDGVAWFGGTASAAIVVAAADGDRDGDGDSDSDSAPSGGGVVGGCSTGGDGSGAALGLALAAIVARRRATSRAG
nr:cellulase family glycosylhydrolase [Kofleriaceae bacterium]